MLVTYRIDTFSGLNQGTEENSLPSGESPEEYNMDTEDGCLRVGKGFVRACEAPVPGEEPIKRLLLFRGAGKTEFLVLAGRELYTLKGGTWTPVYTYDRDTGALASAQEVRIGETDCLLIADGAGQMVKYDGETASLFGSEAGQSNIAAHTLAMYRSRLFAAGPAEHPSRLYWSQLPGGERSIECFSPDSDSVNVEGGHAEIGDTGSDPIVALLALSNQLLIFKERSLYRLIGDKPSNFTVERIDSQLPPVTPTALVCHRDAAYFLTREGISVCNGVLCERLKDTEKLRGILKNAELSQAGGALVGNRLYFRLKTGGEDALIVYDRTRRTFLLRNGFSISDMLSDGTALYFMNEKRILYRFGEGGDYDGSPIHAYWRTPLTDLYEKSAVKGLLELSLRADPEGGEGALIVEASADGVTKTHRVLLPKNAHEVLELPLENEGRTFSLCFQNENGSRFCLAGGVELLLSKRGRTR